MQNSSDSRFYAQQAQQQAQAQQTQVNQERDANIGHYNDLLAHPGYSDTEKQGITNASLAPIGGAYDSLRNSAAMHVAKTGNSAGYGELLGQMARSKGAQVADIGNKNALSFADRAATDRNTALSGLSGMYGVDQEALARQLGIPASYLQTSNQALGGAQEASGNPYLKGFLSSLGKGIGGLAGGTIGA